jgi:hypothetical protein
VPPHSTEAGGQRLIILLGALIVREKTMPLEYACSACDFSYKVSGNLNICAAWWALSEAPLIKQVSLRKGQLTGKSLLIFFCHIEERT